MSNELSIAACTALLRQLLFDEFRNDGSPSVTTLPLDKASNVANLTRRLNLFLYHIAPNAAWRNHNFPEDGEKYSPPLALNLYYLITAYGDDEVEEDDHKILGRAMTLLHENATIRPQQIKALIGAGGPQADLDQPREIKDSDLHEQLERIRISPEPMPVDEMMKLWGTFHQSPYRISAAYQVSVILMKRKSRVPSPFPVFGRGSLEDIGPQITTNLGPLLHGIDYRDPTMEQSRLPAARLGDVFAIYGANLPTRGSRLLLFDPKRETAIGPGRASGEAAELEVLPGGTDSRILARLQSSGDLFAGRMRLVLEYQSEAGRTLWSNPLQLLLAPSLVPDDSPDGVASLILTVHELRRVLIAILRPRPGAQRKVSLLLTPKDDSKPPAAIPGITQEGLSATGAADEEETRTQKLARLLSSPDEVAFDVTEVPPNRYVVRIRLDMVESLPIRRSRDGLVLDSRQEVSL